MAMTCLPTPCPPSATRGESRPALARGGAGGQPGRARELPSVLELCTGYGVAQRTPLIGDLLQAQTRCWEPRRGPAGGAGQRGRWGCRSSGRLNIQWWRGRWPWGHPRVWDHTVTESGQAGNDAASQRHREEMASLQFCAVVAKSLPRSLSAVRSYCGHHGNPPARSPRSPSRSWTRPSCRTTST